MHLIVEATQRSVRARGGRLRHRPSGHGHGHGKEHDHGHHHDHDHDHGHEHLTTTIGTPDHEDLVTAPPALLQLMWLASPACRSAASAIPKGSRRRSRRGRVIDEATAAALAGRSAAPRPGAQRPARRRPGARAWRGGDDERIASLNDWFATTRETRRAAPAGRADGPLARDLAAAPRRADARLGRLEALVPRRPGRSPSRSPPPTAARARATCSSPSPSAGPRTWCRRR